MNSFYGKLPCHMAWLVSSTSLSAMPIHEVKCIVHVLVQSVDESVTPATVSSNPTQYFAKNGLTMMWNNVLALKCFFDGSAPLSIHLHLDCVTRLKMLVVHIQWLSRHTVICVVQCVHHAAHPDLRALFYTYTSALLYVVCELNAAVVRWNEPSVEINRLAWPNVCSMLHVRMRIDWTLLTLTSIPHIECNLQRSA